MMKRIVVIVAILAAIAAAVFWTRSKATARSGGELTLYGNVDIREVNLGFRVPGRITAVLRDEGDAVKAGEVVARLDDEPYRREAEEAAAQVASLTARVQQMEAGPRKEEIDQARALVREREATVTNATVSYKRNEELLARKTISTQERDDAEARYLEARARLGSAQEQLKLLEAGYRQEEIAQARADLQRAKAMQAAAELRVSDSILTSPSDGVVLTRAQEPGAVVPAGATVLTVSLRQPVWVRAFIPEPDLGRIQPGTKVEVRTDTPRSRPLSGQIGYISPRAEFTPKTVETPELRTSLVYRVRITVEDPGGVLRQGMPVTVGVPAS